MREIVVKTIKKVLKEYKINLEDEEIEKYIETPPNPEMGDFAFPCFILSSKLKEEPSQIAIDLRGKIGSSVKNDFEDIQSRGPYLNFFVNRKALASELIREIMSKKDRFGSLQQKQKANIMIEFSQANTHKAFHIGHIRGTSIGESLARILEFTGNKVIRANYQGDTGMHVAKWIWCYKKYHSREKIKKDEAWIASIYVDAVKRLSKHKSLQEEVDEVNIKLSTKEDRSLNALWKKTREFSLDSFEKIYKELNTRFDHYFFESEVEKRSLEIIDDLLKNKIAKVSDGAVIINLKKYKLGVWVLLRKDKTVLYSGKDLALAEKKSKDFKLSQSLYVVASEQDLHLKQLFKTLELMESNLANKSKHVSFGLVRLPHRKMSSRTGDNVLYSDFIKDILEKTKEQIKKREPKISKTVLEERALKISIAAIKYSMLKQSSNKNIIFDPKESINFEGDTGPYMLYSYARANSILTKFNRKKNKKKNSPQELEPQETALIKKLSQFPEVVLSSYKNLNPSRIANYSYQLSQIFNEFYHSSPVINSEQESFRISLVNAFKQVLKNSLNLLGIEVIEKM